MNEFTLIGTLLNVGPLEETSSGIKVVNFYIKTERLQIVRNNVSYSNKIKMRNGPE